ncbi:MAG: hypothetical protein WCK89_13190 [bacterium]
MTAERRKRILSVVGCFFLGWFVLVMLAVPPQDGDRGRLLVKMLNKDARHLEGEVLSREELDAAIRRLPLEFGEINIYRPTVQYTSPSEWQVTLVPDKRRAFCNPSPPLCRVLFLECSRMTYPDITIESNKRVQNTGSKIAEPHP